jgi:CBS domain-containing protein
MRVSDTMTRDVQVASPDDTIAHAAEIMAAIDAGALPVGDKGRLIGMITDRDIVVRAVAAGKGLDTKIKDVMSGAVKYCYEDQDLEDVARNMGDIRLRRLPVVDRDKRLVGIVSLGDVAATASKDAAGGALMGVSRPGGAQSQTR